MKKILISIFTLCLINSVYAQTQVAGSPIYYLTNGNIGVGKTNPSYALDITSSSADVNFRIEDGATGAPIRMRSTNSGEAYIYMGNEASTIRRTGGDFRFWANGIDMAFSTNNGNTNHMFINTAGNIGIGTASPDNTLHVEGDLLLDVYGNSGHEKGIFFREGFSTTNKYNLSFLAYDHNGGGATPDGISINGYDGVSFSTGSNSRNERMRIAQNGNVGIGTTSPRSIFNVNGNNGEAWVNQYGHFVFNHKNVSSTHFWTMAPRSNGFLGIGYGNLTDNEYVSSTNDFLSINSNNGNVGIGTTSSNAKLEIAGATRINSTTPVLHFLENDITDKNFQIDVSGGNLNFRTNNNSFNAASIKLSVLNNGNVGIGTTSPTEKLSVDGNILAKKVRVSIAASDWPDYVFKAGYTLISLGELETYIKENQHLPEIPSAKEVATSGLDLGSMDASLLKKVEELTLYLIQENKDKEALRKENTTLKNTLEEVLKRIEKLEKH